MFTKKDMRFMRMALGLAKRGRGRTSPNPPVGAVVVRDGKVVGKGWHRRAGGPHAEVFALEDAGTMARGATLYVTLEPCNHFGRTPPCTKAVLEAGIARCVIGALDPNPSVAGGGAEFLKKNGVEVASGCLEFEAKGLIAPFVKHMTTGLPWVRVKVASTLDGKIATKTNDSKWITGPKARRQGHVLRNISDAIMVGRNTVEADDPSLTCRLNAKDARDPVRVVLDTHLRLSPSRRIFNLESSAPTVVFCSREEIGGVRQQQLQDRGVKVIGVEKDENEGVVLEQVLKCLGDMAIQSVLVEGGAQLNGALFSKGLVDEVYFFFAPKVMGGAASKTSVGGRGPLRAEDALFVHHTKTRRIGPDILIHGYMKEGLYH